MGGARQRATPHPKGNSEHTCNSAIFFCLSAAAELTDCWFSGVSTPPAGQAKTQSRERPTHSRSGPLGESTHAGLTHAVPQNAFGLAHKSL